MKDRDIGLAILSLIANLVYAFYHGALGLAERSVWFGSMCVYYLLLSAMRFAAVLGDQAHDIKREKPVMRLTGGMLAVMSIVMALVFRIGLLQKTAIRYDEIPMIAITTYTFTKIIVAAVKAARERSHPSPARRALRTIRYAEVAAAVFTMQCSMLLSFGDMDEKTASVFNTCTGSAACLFTLILGLILLFRKTRTGESSWNAQNLQKQAKKPQKRP